MKLLVSMGIPLKDFQKKEEGFRYNGAVIQIIDWQKKTVEKEIKYKSPDSNLGYDLSMMFKGAYVTNKRFWVVTNTEVLEYESSTTKLLNVFSHCSFNDLHAIFVYDNQIYVCNTGLEVVQRLTITGEITKQWNIAEKPTKERFSSQIDYRKIATTKPHEVHINHLFNLDGEIWVNLGSQRKALSLENKNRFIDIDSIFSKEEKVLCHDGLVTSDCLYFTSVNGYIVVVNKQTLKVEEKINLNKLLYNRGKVIGWTRGIEVVGNKAYIGVSKLRHSKFKEYTKWLVKGHSISLPSSILELNLVTNSITDIYQIEHYQGAAVYSIIAIEA